jgi:LemA protein
MVVFLIVVCAAVFTGVLIFNRMVSLRNMLQEALSGVDVQLKRRHDLIPNLVKIVEGYGHYEKALLEKVTAARNQTAGTQPLVARGGIETDLAKALRSFLAVAEAYPDLKADKQFTSLHESLVKVEDELQMARRYYNGAVRDYNILLQSFPGNILASRFGFTPAAFFEVEYATDRVVPDVDLSSRAGV